MSDAGTRELERRWRETGAVADEAAWLTERLRAGSLERARVLDAAALGHAAARLMLGAAAPPLVNLPGASWSRADLKRAAAAVARAVVEQVPDLEPSLREAELALACPCQAHAWRAVRAMQALTSVEDGPDGAALCAPRPAAAVVIAALDDAHHVERESSAAATAVSCAAELLGEDAARAAIVRDLGPFLVGTADPLRERCEAHSPGALAQGNPVPPDTVSPELAVCTLVISDLEGMPGFEYDEEELFAHPSGRFIRRRTHLHCDADRARVTTEWLDASAGEAAIEALRRARREREARGGS